MRLPTLLPDRAFAFLALGTGLATCLIAMQILGDWQVDDSAISLAFARNLQLGRGLVAQPGDVPVEGFSNPLWVLLLALFPTGQTIIYAKYLGACFYVAAIVRLADGLGSVLPRPVASWGAILLALQPSVVIWSLSGLENALWLLLSIEIFVRSARDAASEVPLSPAGSAIACSLASILRPEGIVLAAIALAGISLSRDSRWSRLKRSAAVLVPVVMTAVVWLLFRVAYFHEVLPTPYYAKGGLTWVRVQGLALLNAHTREQLTGMASSVFGHAMAGGGLIVSVLLIVTANIRSRDRVLFLATLTTLLTLFTALLLPTDWMSEYRYFTAVYGPFLIALIHSVLLLWSRIIWLPIATIVIAAAAINCWQRVSVFSDSPTISVEEVEKRSIVFEQWGALLGLARPSILTADVGGLLLRSRLEVIDLGMLCDMTIAKQLGEGTEQRDLAGFHDYIFERRKPDFISTRAYHAWIARFSADPRFRAMYVPIREYQDQWILNRFGEIEFAGDYVRAELVEGQHGVLRQMRAEAMGMSYPFCGACSTYGPSLSE